MNFRARAEIGAGTDTQKAGVKVRNRARYRDESRSVSQDQEIKAGESRPESQDQ